VTEGGQLFITGRDLEDKRLAVRFNKDTCLWSCEGVVQEEDEELQERDKLILKALTGENETGLILTAGQVAVKLGKPVDTVRTWLWRLVNKGHVTKPAAGLFGRTDLLDKQQERVA
jgi:hypothetical protein